MTKYIVLLLLLLPPVAFADIEITYIMCNPVGSDTDGEYIKVKNTGSSDIDLTGWWLNDGSVKLKTLEIPPINGGIGDMILAPNEVAMLANKADKVSGESIIIDIDTVMSLSNSGDTVKLLDASKVEQVSVTYSKDDVVEGNSCITGSSNDSSTNGGDLGGGNTVVNEVTTYKTVVIEPPQDIHIREIQDKAGLLGGIIYIQPEVYDAIGKVPEVACYITFGDGYTTTKCDASHIYRYAGEYIVKVVVSKGTLSGETVFNVNIVEPQLWLTVAEDKKYVELHNASDIAVELNGWLVQVGYKRFSIPSRTMVQASGSIKISTEVMHMDIARLGGKAELHNVFNKIMQAEPVAEPVTVVGEVELEEELIEETAAITGPVVSTKGPLVRHSVIGTIVTNERPSVTDTKEATEKQLPIKPSKQVIEPTAQVASVGILPSNKMPWVLGLLGLLTLALLPLLFGKVKDGGHQDMVGEGDASDKFTIREIM